MGSSELGDLIREVAGKNVSAAEKVRLLTEGARTIEAVSFDIVETVLGVEAVFQGAPRAIDGKSPLLVVLKDGRMMRGFDDALIPDPSEADTHLRILLSRLRELS